MCAAKQAEPPFADDSMDARQKMAPSIAQNAMAETILIAKKPVERNVAISRNDSKRTAFAG